MNGKIIIFSGYAGAGENTIINILQKGDESQTRLFIFAIFTQRVRELESQLSQKEDENDKG